MYNSKNNKGTPSKGSDSQDVINPGYDYSTEYGDANTPEIDKPKPTSATDVIPDEVPRRDGPGGE